ARVHGGVWILDRKNRLYWALDRHFRVVTRDQGHIVLRAGQLDIFQPADGSQTHSTLEICFPTGIRLDAASPVEEVDPISIDALPGDIVLILDANSGAHASIGAYRFGQPLQGAVVTGSINGSLNNIGSRRLFPAAYDFAFAPGTDSTSANPG